MKKSKWSYIWGAHTIRKVDDTGMDILKHDTEKKPEIPFLSIFGRIHARFLKQLNKRKRYG